VDIVETRRALGAFVVDNFFRHTARLAKLHPLASPARHGVEVVRDIPYASSASHHLLDVYRPQTMMTPRPVVLYVHGGGFRILSKDSHWVMALSFARRGYVVFNINYRLAPAHPFPAALEDVSAAYEWVVKNAASWGGDSERIVLAGESAGANLVAALTLATTYERPEPYARRVFDLHVVPQAVLPACGMFQVTDIDRFARRRNLPPWLMDRLHEVSSAYLPKRAAASDCELADPLVILERGAPPARPLPPFFLPVGTKDPLLDDTRRLSRALDALGIKNEARYYPGEMHAFHAFVFRKAAREAWRDSFAFLDSVMASDEKASDLRARPPR
jgi:acetyl esterase